MNKIVYRELQLLESHANSGAIYTEFIFGLGFHNLSHHDFNLNFGNKLLIRNK